MSTERHGRRPERPPFWVAFGFIAAFAATILTVVLTGLYVRAPGSAGAEADSAAATAEPAGTPTDSAEARRSPEARLSSEGDTSPEVRRSPDTRITDPKRSGLRDEAFKSPDALDERGDRATSGSAESQ